ncbi:MAG: glycosyltransferase family 4 protein [Patescibacteria group bacterium]|nr:glycosyltransferase family 4 protein [Patescibacteria group bacterium]
MPKILQIITLSEWGGAQRVVYDLALGLKNSGFEVGVACQAAGLLVEKLKEQGIAVFEIKSLKREISPWRDLAAFFALLGIIEKGKYDIVHCHSAKAGILGRWAAKFSRTKKIFYTVHSWGFYNQEEYGWGQKLFTFLEKSAAKITTRIICVSQKVFDDGLKNKIAKANKMIVVRNGIDFPIAAGDRGLAREKTRQELGLNKDDVAVGMVARLAYPKDPLAFLSVAQKMTGDLLRAKFVLIGDGPLMADCESFVQKNNLSTSVFLLGEKSPEKTREILFGLDIFVLISKFEGLPVTILEAMFAGLPIVASDVGGIAEAVGRDCGFLIKNNDAGAFVAALTNLIKNPGLRQEMGGKNRQRAQGEFSLSEMVKETINIYESRK